MRSESGYVDKVSGRGLGCGRIESNMKKSKKIILTAYSLIASIFFVLVTRYRYYYERDSDLNFFALSIVFSALILFVLWLFVYRRPKLVHGKFNLLEFIIIFFPAYVFYSLALISIISYSTNLFSLPFLVLSFCVFGLPGINLLSRFIFGFGISLKSSYVVGILLTALTTCLTFFMLLSIYGLGPNFRMGP